MERSSFLEKDWVSVSDYSSGAQILQQSGQLPDRWTRPITAWPVLPKCLLGCSYLCCSIYVATTHRLVNLKTYHRIAHWITATGKHVLQPKLSSGNSCFFLSLLAVFFPANFFQNKPYIREWCFLSFPVGLTCGIALWKESDRSKQSPYTNLSFRRKHTRLWHWHWW